MDIKISEDQNEVIITDEDETSIHIAIDDDIEHVPSCNICSIKPFEICIKMKCQEFERIDRRETHFHLKPLNEQ